MEVTCLMSSMNKPLILAIVDYTSFAAKVYTELSVIFDPILRFYNDEVMYKDLIVMPNDVKLFIEVITTTAAGVDPAYELEERLRQRYCLNNINYEPSAVQEALFIGCAVFIDFFEEYTRRQLRNSKLLEEYYYFRGWLNRDSFSCILSN